MSEAPVMLLLFRVINLTVVGRLNFEKKNNFFLQNLHMTTILCVECQELIKKLVTVL